MTPSNYHCGMPANERAVQLAQEGATEARPDVPVTYYQKKRITKSTRKPPIPVEEDYHIKDRPEQVIILHLRMGHNGLCSQICIQFKIGIPTM